MTQITIRVATVGDLDLLAAGNIAAAQETEGRSLDGETARLGVRRVLEDPAKGVYYVAELDGRVVGQLLITCEWSDWRERMFWWIQSVYVVPDARRQGVYRALHTWIEQQARATPGVCGLRLYVEHNNTRAQQTYEHLGMSPAHYRMYETTWNG